MVMKPTFYKKQQNNYKYVFGTRRVLFLVMIVLTEFKWLNRPISHYESHYSLYSLFTNRRPIYIFQGIYLMMGATPCKNVSSGIYGQRRPRSACASAQSDQYLHCPLTKSLNTIECFNGNARVRLCACAG